MGIKLKTSGRGQLYCLYRGRNHQPTAVSEEYEGKNRERNVRDGILSTLQAILDADIRGTSEIVDAYLETRSGLDGAEYGRSEVWGWADIDALSLKRES